MTIDTRYNIGDEVWFMDDKGQIKSDIIHAMSYYYWDSTISPEEEIELQYCFNSPIGRQSWYDESDLFPTKEELLKSL